MRKLDDVMSETWEKKFPKAIQIETDSRCNSHCSYCPYSETSKLFPHSKMDDKLFLKIINELKIYSPKMIAIYMNNEPLIDSSIFNKIKTIKNTISDIFIDFSTNASLLTNEVSYKLIGLNIDEIKINVPSTNKEKYEKYTQLNYNTVFKNIKNFVFSAKDNNFDGRYRIIIVGSENPEDDMKYWSKVGIEAKVYQKLSRGGSIETDMETKNEIFGCKYNRDKEWMHILSNGDVVLCCMDWYREHKLGNVQESLLYDIWNGTDYQKIREKINHSNDRDFICNKCEWGLTNKNL